MSYLLTFTDPIATQISYSGGKGANLALLTQRHFPVPPGGIIIAAGYRDFVAPIKEELRQRVQKLPFGNAQLMETACAEIEHLLSTLPLPTQLQEDVATFLTQFPERHPFSVRSSSTLEDLATAAFAGQHETFLNCIGLPYILQKIKECFISLWGARAVGYRQQHQFNHFAAAMAVVLQEMVPCDVAGVGFSINPVNGHLNEAVFDANFGLGESVVSGEGAIDHFVVDKKSGSIKESTIVEKNAQIISTTQGVAWIETDSTKAAQPALTETEISELMHLLNQVEQSYQFPQDIEWGIAKGTIYLLQSRPITTIPPRWTREESAERFPNVITPLSWDFSEKGFHTSLNFSFKLMGHPPYNGKWFAMHNYYIYGNQNAVELYAHKTPPLPRTIEELRTLMPHIPAQFRWVQELPIIWSRDLDYYLIRIGEFMAEPLDNKDVTQLWSMIDELREHATLYFLPNIAISLTHQLLYRLLHYLLTMFVGDEAPKLFGRLLAYCETKTGKINGELFEMAQMIQTDPELAQQIMERPSREITTAKILDNHPELGPYWQKFLRNHGHREIDLDGYHPTWIEAPWVVVDNLRLILQSPMDITPAEKELQLKIQMQRAELKLWQIVPEDMHPLFDELIRLARVYTSLDDLEHYQTTRIALPMRRLIRALGEKVVAMGHITDPMDLFFAHLVQLEEAVTQNNATGWQTLGTQISKQKEAYLKAKEGEPDWILGRKEVATENQQFLKGLPGSTGQVTGEIFTVFSTDDFSRFPKGAILVARTTNPTWTPLFYSAIGVITESGGPLSHGAVTAREMQIPAVMSVRSALTKLKNGQKVTIDGELGRVYLHDD